MSVPFLDLVAAYNELKDELDAAYCRVMQSGWYIFGEKLQAFEASFADFCEAKHCIGVANGLDALTLILQACGIRPGDEVIVPANTYIATWLAASYAGATPVPVEPDIRTYNIDAKAIEAAITPVTRAVIAVHLYGQPAEIDAVLEVSGRKGIAVIEDAAQAHGARYRGRRMGSFGIATGFSFYPGKNLGAFGDGGAVTTDDDFLADQVRVLGNYGSRKKYYHERQGVNSRLDPLQAAFLQVKLSCLDRWNQRRRNIAQYYLEALTEVPDLVLPQTIAEADSVWHLFVVRHPQRDRLQKHLSDRGIGTLIHYPVPPHLSKAYADRGWKTGSFPITETIAETALSLPIGPHVTQEQAAAVVSAIQAFS